MKPSEEKKYLNFYEKSAKNIQMPYMHMYEYLYERNKNYMNNTAITFYGTNITYEELHQRIDEYAKALYKKGVREGDVVALSLANTPEAVYLQYAINKLGAVSCLVNPTFNSYKMARDFDIANPKFFIGINDSYKNFKLASKGRNIESIIYPAVNSIPNNKIKFLYGMQQLLKGNMPLNNKNSLNKILENGSNFNGVKYASKYEYPVLSDIMFTGGTSGTHKGVDLDSNGINCVSKSLDYVTDLQPGEKFIGNLPQFMAFGKLSFHYALCKNLNLEIILKVLPQDFVSELIRIQPAGAFGGPVHWEQFLNNDLLKGVDLSYLRMPVSGGEQLKKNIENQVNLVLQEHNCPSTLWNGLGCTEMWAPVSVKRGNLNSVGSLGTIIPGNIGKIVTNNVELNYNEAGELHLSGPALMLGYHNNEEETKKVIYTDEFNTRWFNTGDIAKFNSNGELFFCGRTKRSFVCGVDNIYPEQIENILCEMEEIASAVVTSIPDTDKQYVPKYHIFLNNECDIEKLKKKIKKRILNTLGNSALPSFYEFHIEHIIYTANGKIDVTKYQNDDNNKIKKLSI